MVAILCKNRAKFDPVLGNTTGIIVCIELVKVKLGVQVTLTKHLDGQEVHSTGMLCSFATTDILMILCLRLIREHNEKVSHVFFDSFWLSNELVSSFSQITDIQYSLYVDGSVQYSWKDWGKLLAAEAIYVEEASAELCGNLGVCKTVLSRSAPTALSDLLNGCKKALIPIAINSVEGLDQDTNYVAIISYFSKPIDTVAVKRISYWEEELGECLAQIGRQARILSISACGGDGDHDNYDKVVVRDTDGRHSAPIRKLNRDALDSGRINTLAYLWADDIIHVFETGKVNRINISAVVISGNPFHYFAVGKYFKNKYGAKIIFDFRDPMSGNTRLKYSNEQREQLRVIERGLTNSADVVVSVNETCLESLVTKKGMPRRIISNGFDERLIRKRSRRPKSNVIKFVYTGTFYTSCSPLKFVSALNSETGEFRHAGRRQAVLSQLEENEAFSSLGVQPSSKIFDFVAQAHIGCIFTADEFENTTKVYDYLAAGIDILIVYEGIEPRKHELWKMLDNLSGVYWVENNPREISRFLSNYQPSSLRRQFKSEFSRGGQALRLAELICEGAS
ncbi:MAG: hypothetical protein P8P99_10520 [Maricaulis sp.]|nr:hypothetical protein [Maricaulis sp.]